MKYESHSEAMAIAKGFADKKTDRQTDKQMGQKLYASDLLMLGHKKHDLFI